MIDDSKYAILGIGAACIDLIVDVSEEILTEISGLKGGSRSIEQAELEHILNLIPAKPCLTTGGSCANVIKCLAALGESTAFLSAIGQDAFGARFVEYFAAQNIHGIFTTSPFRNCCVLCLVTPDGQRTMRFLEGSTLSLSVELLRPAYFEGIQLLHIDSYSLRRPGLVERAMQLAKQAGALISIDLSSVEIVQEHMSELNTLLNAFVDIVFANIDETKAFTGLSPEEGCLKLQTLCSVAVVTMGKEGCLVGRANAVMHCAATPVKMVDSTGAGDFFAGGFLHGYLQKKTLKTCAEWGSSLGAAVVQVKGVELPAEQWQSLRIQFI